jgi:hypothetical protein
MEAAFLEQAKDTLAGDRPGATYRTGSAFQFAACPCIARIAQEHAPSGTACHSVCGYHPDRLPSGLPCWRRYLVYPTCACFEFTFCSDAESLPCQEGSPEATCISCCFPLLYELQRATSRTEADLPLESEHPTARECSPFKGTCRTDIPRKLLYGCALCGAPCVIIFLPLTAADCCFPLAPEQQHM